MVKVRLVLSQPAPDPPVHSANLKRFARPRGGSISPDATRIAPVGIALDVFLKEDSVQPWIFVAIDVPERFVWVQSRIQAPVSLSCRIEGPSRLHTVVDIPREDESVRLAVVPPHDRLDDTMKPAEFTKSRHLNAPPNSRHFDLKGDDQLREVRVVALHVGGYRVLAVDLLTCVAVSRVDDHLTTILAERPGSS
jgi:hypothetical protein